VTSGNTGRDVDGKLNIQDTENHVKRQNICQILLNPIILSVSMANRCRAFSSYGFPKASLSRV